MTGARSYLPLSDISCFTTDVLVLLLRQKVRSGSGLEELLKSGEREERMKVEGKGRIDSEIAEIAGWRGEGKRWRERK